MVWGQNPAAKFTISQINISGNKKTKEHVILREIDIKAGDSFYYFQKDSLIHSLQNKIFNLALFIKVKVFLDSLSVNERICRIEVSERFYTIPGLSIELADRTFNEWWYLYNHRLNRLQYGFSIIQKNCFGLNHTLSTIVQTGFSDYYSIGYLIPFIKLSKNSGFNLNFQYLKNDELAYNISDSNMLKYIRNDSTLRIRTRTDAEFRFQENLFTKHQITFSFHTNSISEKTYQLNSNYLLPGIKRLNFFSLAYLFDLNKTDIHFYPTKGYHVQANFSYSGLLSGQNFRHFNYNFYLASFNHHKKKAFLANSLYFEGLVANKPSYLYSPSLGYSGIFIRSYEYYLIKGTHLFLNKNELKYKITDKWINLKFLPLTKFNNIPLQIYPKLFLDIGFLSDKNLFSSFLLNNKYLLGVGTGIDLVSYYDIVIRIEAGYNLNREKSLFFHLNKGI